MCTCWEQGWEVLTAQLSVAFGFKGLWMWYDSHCLVGFYHTQPCLENPVSSKRLTDEWGQGRIRRCDVQKDISAQSCLENGWTDERQPNWFTVGTRPWSHINWTTLEVHISCFSEYFFMVWRCFCRLLVFILNELCWTLGAVVVRSLLSVFMGPITMISLRPKVLNLNGLRWSHLGSAWMREAAGGKISITRCTLIMEYSTLWQNYMYKNLTIELPLVIGLSLSYF